MMAREAMQDRYQEQYWMLFRRPGQFFYDYAVRYRRRDFQHGECEIEVPWLGRTFYSWLWTNAAHVEMVAALTAQITARSGVVYRPDDGAVTQAFWQEPATVLIGQEQARARPLIWGTAAQRMTGRQDAMMEMPVAVAPGVRQVSLFEMLGIGGR